MGGFAKRMSLAMSDRRTVNISRLLLLVAIIGGGVALRTADMSDVVTRTPDERVYTHYAVAVVDGGLPAVRRVFADYLSDPSSWIYPGPTRLTHVFLFATMMRITDLRDSRAGAMVSWAASVGSLVLTAWIGYRFFNPWVGLIGATFMASCFGELGCVRRAWGDSTASCLSLALMLIALEIRRTPKRTWLYALLFAVGAAALLNKETAILAYALCGFWLSSVMAVEKRSWPLFGRVAAAGIASILAAIIIWYVLAGGGAIAWNSFHQVNSSGLGSDAWGQEYASGPWFQFVYFLWLVGPVTLVMALLGVSIVGSSDSWLRETLGISDRGGLSLAIFVTLTFIGVAAFGPNLQYLRVMAPANGAYCLLAGLGVWLILVLARRSMPDAYYQVLTLCVAVALALSTVADYRRFNEVVVQTDMQDMSVKDVRDVLGR